MAFIGTSIVQAFLCTCSASSANLGMAASCSASSSSGSCIAAALLHVVCSLHNSRRTSTACCMSCVSKCSSSRQCSTRNQKRGLCSAESANNDGWQAKSSQAPSEHHNQLSIELILPASVHDMLNEPMLLQGNLRQDEFPTLSGDPHGPGGPPDGAAFGRHPAYEEDERQFVGQPGQCSMVFCDEPSDVEF